MKIRLGLGMKKHRRARWEHNGPASGNKKSKWNHEKHQRLSTVVHQNRQFSILNDGWNTTSISSVILWKQKAKQDILIMLRLVKKWIWPQLFFRSPGAYGGLTQWGVLCKGHPPLFWEKDSLVEFLFGDNSTDWGLTFKKPFNNSGFGH